MHWPKVYFTISTFQGKVGESRDSSNAYFFTQLSKILKPTQSTVWGNFVYFIYVSMQKTVPVFHNTEEQTALHTKRSSAVNSNLNLDLYCLQRAVRA